MQLAMTWSRTDLFVFNSWLDDEYPLVHHINVIFVVIFLDDRIESKLACILMVPFDIVYGLERLALVPTSAPCTPISCSSVRFVAQHAPGAARHFCLVKDSSARD